MMLSLKWAYLHSMKQKWPFFVDSFFCLAVFCCAIMLLIIWVALLVTDHLNATPKHGFDAVFLSVVLMQHCASLLLGPFCFRGLRSFHPGPVPPPQHGQGLGCDGDAS